MTRIYNSANRDACFRFSPSLSIVYFFIYCENDNENIQLTLRECMIHCRLSTQAMKRGIILTMR